MRKRIVTPVAALIVFVAATLPAAARGEPEHGSFVARAVPFPAMDFDGYYPQKGSCLGGADGIHKVSQPFHAPARGTLSVYVSGLSGDWDLYVLTASAGQLGRSDSAQVLEGAEGKERVTVALEPHQGVQMVACNWLGETEVTVHFDFRRNKVPGGHERHDSHSGQRMSRTTTHRVDAAGGPVTPLWEWDPSDVEIQVGHKVVWRNETASGHHVTPYAGPWNNGDVMHLPIGGKAGFVFDKPGEYLYRCDFAFAGVEHSVLVGDECVGMCGRVVVKKQRSR